MATRDPDIFGLTEVQQRKNLRRAFLMKALGSYNSVEVHLLPGTQE